MTRGDSMTPAKVQLVPRGRWQSCLWSDNKDGTAMVLIGAKEYTVRIESVIPRKEKNDAD